MAAVLCGDCLRTYTPYTYSETLQRALVSGVDEGQSVDNEETITSRYNEVLYIRLGITRTIRNLFPSVQHFRDCHRQFNRERRKKISASFLCFDCEKYLCDKCITQHSKHFTFSEDDKNNMDKWDKIETNIMQAFNREGDTKEEYIKQERAVLCNVVDVRDSVSVEEWEEFMSSEIGDVYEIGRQITRFYDKLEMFMLNDNETFLVINDSRTDMKLYNTSSYELIDTIELPDIPEGITEIPSTDPSQTLIAVSFSNAGHIDIMDIQRRPADVISSINIHGRCYDLAYCNNKLITRCRDFPNRELRASIHVMDISGDLIKFLDLNKLGGIEEELLYTYPMSVYSESETIYLCHRYYGVTCMSLTGKVLHSTTFTEMYPSNVFVDRDGHVYVMGDSLPLYKLTSDLNEEVEIIDKDAANVRRVTSIKHHKNKIYMATMEGFVYIFDVD